MTVPQVDARDVAAFAAALLARGPGYVPEWRPREQGAETAIVHIAARYLQAVARRLDQAPQKNELAFLEVLGTRLVPAQPSRTPMVFRLADRAADLRLPAGTRVAAPPPPGATAQVVFETERSTGLAVARLEDVVSLWPGRDQYIDHSADHREGDPFTLFEPAALVNTPHVLYLAHDTLLALDGNSAVTVAFDLTTPSSDYLDIRWEYWDGEVWRPFKDMRPACSNAEAEQRDGTVGLQRSGSYRLEAECATTARTTIGGTEALWIRGRLAKTLPGNPARVLPEVESIRLSTEIDRSYDVLWRADIRLGRAGQALDTLVVRVLDATGVPIEGVDVQAVETTDFAHTGPHGTTELEVREGQPTTIAIALGDFEQETTVKVDEVPLELTFTLDMPGLERAALDGTEVDLSSPFFPFGLQPQPGAAFYFTHAEAFSKPGARLRLYVQPTVTAQDELAAPTVPGPQATETTRSGEGDLEHVVSWEYWNGRRWASLLTTHSDDDPQPSTFLARGLIDLPVPEDMAPTTVVEQEGLWMRVRLVSGGYGAIRSVAVTTAAGTTNLRFFVPQPPALADLRIGYAWQRGPFAPEYVLAFNDFRYEDRTALARWPGNPFQPFVPIADPTPGLYLGYDRPLPVDDLGVLFNVVEDREDTLGPTLVWEYWDGFNWQRLSATDETRNLRVTGIVSVIGPGDMRPLARFAGAERYWVRARLNEDGPPGAPVLAAVFANAVWALQQQTVVDESLGASSGQANEVIAFRQAPILPGQEIEVRELAGRRANVEWRILAAELFGSGAREIAELEAALGAEGQGDVEREPLRLRRNRFKEVDEAWVRWEERATLWLSAPTDRHYAVDRTRGRLLLGDGWCGRVPPAGAELSARLYRTGGGRVGNLPARAVSQPQGAIGGLEEVFNAMPAEGGADAETAEQVIVRGPRSLHHRGRAVGAGDYESLAREASPSVAVARALPARDPAGRATAGWVTLVITPQSTEPQPYPSFGLRDRVRRFVAERAPADLAAADQIYVTGPDYQPVDVTATLVISDPAEAGAVERAAHEAIAAFLNPLRGGPAGNGWQPGEDVYVSDLAAVVERTAGVDYASELGLLQGGIAQGERLAIGEGRVAVAGEIRIRLVGA
jgi:uncharacterized phage protein gp47/JayE